MLLHNRLGKPELLKKLNAENFKRCTLSFYRYVNIENPQLFRNELYQKWNELACLGRIYVAAEGINAQMNVPEHNLGDFLAHLESIPQLKQMPIKWAVEDDGRSFFKLAFKVRNKIVADGLEDGAFDVTNVGNHLSPIEFHNLVSTPDVIVVDMRNKYESEVGRFENAICPDVFTFRDELQIVVDELKDKKDNKILLYCTGGVRCEKASAWMKHHGFNDVNQLHGGIIAYAREIKEQGLASKFIGKNFVFDNRLGERITDDVISHCHQCGKPSDRHTNCAYQPCHELVIQCPECAAQYNDCCSSACQVNYREAQLFVDNSQKKSQFAVQRSLIG